MGKIVIVTNHSYMLWRFRKELIAELQKNYEVVLCMPFVGHEDDFKAMGLRCIETKIDRRGINPVTDFKLMKEYERILRTEQPDLVITYSIKPNIYAGIVCGKLGIPFCANVQGLGTAFQRQGLAQIVTMLYKYSFRKVRTVFFENKANAEEFQKRKIIPVQKQWILKGAGINLEQYQYCEYPKNDKFRFLYLGRIMREKGMDELFTAAEILHAEGEEFMLDLVGFFEDEYKEKVERLERMGIAVFHGFQENPLPYYEKADCVVLPSYHEGMSNVLLEAAAVGRPLITSAIPGCREAVDFGKTGLLMPPKDTNALYTVMKQMIQTSREEREQMGTLGAQKMAREFDKEIVVRETIEALLL